MGTKAVKIEEEEFDHYAADERHREILKALSKLPGRASVEARLQIVGQKLDKLIEKETPLGLEPVETVLSKGLTEIRDLLGDIKGALSRKAIKGFRVERDQDGFIEKVVVE